MLRRFFAGLLTAALAATLLVFGSISPAQAQISGVCAVGPPISLLEVVQEPGLFMYRVRHNGKKNNVNIRIRNANKQQIWSWDSPDNRRGEQWYTMQPSIQVPVGGTVTFTAIFDVFGPDPRCTYTTTVCCSGNGWQPSGASGPYVTKLNELQLRTDVAFTARIDYRVRAPGMADSIYLDQGSIFTIRQATHGGKTVRVDARIQGMQNWHEVHTAPVFTVPALPPPPPPPPPPPCEPIPPELICWTPGVAAPA